MANRKDHDLCQTSANHRARHTHPYSHLVHGLALCRFASLDLVVDHNVQITVVTGIGRAREFSTDNVTLLDGCQLTITC
jgi:hypothetical protein